MDVYEAIRDRSTADAFAAEAPPRELVQRLIDTAVWAPNHHLTEPWRFVVLAGAERELFGGQLAEWLERGGNGATPDERDLRSARESLLRSPVALVLAQIASEDGSATRELEDYAACCCVAQNLMLAAHAERLSSKWTTGRLSQYARARELLGLAPRDRIVGYFHLGYPAPEEEPKERQRSAPHVVWRGM